MYRKFKEAGHEVCGVGLGGPDIHVDLQIASYKVLRTLLHTECDVLINNAAVLEYGSLSHHNESQFTRVIDINLTVPFVLTKYFIDAWESYPSTELRIINMTSMAVKKACRMAPGYVASKAGLEALTRALARELAGKPYIFANVAPCSIEDTAMQREGIVNLQTRGMTPEQAATYQADTNGPMGRLATHDEIFKVVKFAVEDMPQIMSGTTLWIPAAYGI